VKADFCVGVALLFFASIYMGTGFGLVALQFPGALENTKPDDFGTRFGSAVRLATIYFTVAITSMVVGGLWLAYRDCSVAVERCCRSSMPFSRPLRPRSPPR
jgi:hypothetical protein